MFSPQAPETKYQLAKVQDLISGIDFYFYLRQFPQERAFRRSLSTRIPHVPLVSTISKRSSLFLLSLASNEELPGEAI